MRDLYEPIEASTHQPAETLRQNSLESNIARWLNETLEIRSDDDVLIYFAFDNIEVNGQDVYFDIMAKTSEAGIRFAETDLYLNYSVTAFGENLVANEKIEAWKETIIEGQTYTLELNDQNENVVELLVNHGFEPDELYPMSQFFEKMIRVRLDIETIYQLAQLSFDDLTFNDQSIFYDPDTQTYFGFDKIGVEDPMFPFMMPEITSFSSYEIPAGTRRTEDILTIIGKNLGDLQDGVSKVYFRNANREPTGPVEDLDDYFSVSTPDILSWQTDPSDGTSTVIVRLPGSANLPGMTQGTAGSGLVFLDNGFNNPVVNETLYLTVPYSIENIRTSNNVEQRVSIIKRTLPSNDFDLMFTIDQSVVDIDNDQDSDNDEDALQITKDAIERWRCSTNVAWSYESQIGNGAIIDGTDSVDNILFTDSVNFDLPNTLGETYLTGLERLDECGGARIYNTDIDIALNNSKSFSFEDTDGTIPLFQKDYFALILHELGHAHGIGHALGYSKIMYPVLYNGESMKRVPTPEDVSGGQDILAYHQDNYGTTFCPLLALGEFSCVVNTSEATRREINLILFPNPTGCGQIVRLSKVFRGSLKITSNIGEVVYIDHEFDSAQLNMTTSLAKGIYYIEFSNTEDYGIYKLIIQ